MIGQQKSLIGLETVFGKMVKSILLLAQMFVCIKFKIYLCLDTILLLFKQIYKTYPNTYYSNNQKYCLILNTLSHGQQCNRSLNTFIINDDLQN